MAVYDIPGITTSVIDYSMTQQALPGGRTPLIAGPSKFGLEDLMEFATMEEVIYKTGGPNYIKFGPALEYVIGALSVTGSVLFKRLVASDATFANINLKLNETTKTIEAVSNSNVTDIKFFNNNNLLNHFGKARGEGYNEFFIQYTEAPDIEKMYADADGDSKYKYNFLRATIYQNSPNGIKTIASNIAISLIDTDPRDNTPIFDLTTGETLYINDRIDSKNDFINVKINEEYLPDLKKYLDINDVITDQGTPEVILKDTQTGTNYKVFGDATGNLYIQATNKNGLDKIILKYYNNGAYNYIKLYVENGKLIKESTTDVTASDVTYDAVYIEGDLNFFKVYVNEETEELTVEEFKTLRSDVYKKLLGKVWVLENGFDGKNMHINGVMNFNGPGEIGSENVKMLLIDFFNTDSKIREVMYPEYTFNYVVDWSSDYDVMNSIINLTDDIGRALGILALPIAYKANDDYVARTEKLYQSSYNNVLYSGQWNLNHYDEFIGKNIAMSPTYYMMINHLKIDNTISITEPVAGMVKAQLPVSNVKLSYIVSSADIKKLRDVQINTIIKETDGIYCIDQLTMYKKASKLSRINVVKVIQLMRTDLPKLLKPFIQLKETNNIISQVLSTVNNYMSKWIVTGNNSNPDEIFEMVSVNATYLKDEYKLIVSVRVKPIGTIEKIDIPIIVE